MTRTAPSTQQRPNPAPPGPPPPAAAPGEDGPARGRSAGQWFALVVGLAALVAAGMFAVGASGSGPDATPAADSVPDTAAAADDAPDADAVAGAEGEDAIAVSMTEFSFSPDTIDVDAGSHTFTITNDGAAPHEWALSPSGEHGEHVAESGELAPGESTTLTVDLDPGTYEFACHISGHYEAGMHGQLLTAAADGTVPASTGGTDAHDGGAADADDEGAANAHDEGAADAHDDGAAVAQENVADESHDGTADHQEDGHEPDAHGDAAPGQGSDNVPDAHRAATAPIEVSMTEFAYTPDHLELPAGTHTLIITNDGQVPHEWALAETGDHHGHGATTRELAPGETQELTVELMPGEYEYMCHLDGHLEAGMVGTLTVTG